MSRKNDIIAVDLGATSHKILHGRQHEDNSHSLDTFAMHPSSGYKNGNIIDLELFKHSFKAALDDLAYQTGQVAKHINVVGISTDETFSLCSRGVAEVKQGVVHPYDLETAMISARNVSLPDDYVLIHVIPIYYEVDHRVKVMDPVGLSGRRLDGYFHIIGVPKALVENHRKVFAQMSIEVDQLVLSSVVNHNRVSSDEVDQTILKLDFSATSTRAAVFQNEACTALTSVPYGGNHVDQDISVCCKLSTQLAEQSKINFMMKSLSSRLSHQQQHIYEIIDARYEEIIRLLISKVREGTDFAKVKIACMGSAYRPDIIDPIILSCCEDATIHHCHVDSELQINHSNWMAYQLFEYHSSQTKHVDTYQSKSFLQFLRKCKNWLEYHF